MTDLSAHDAPAPKRFGFWQRMKQHILHPELSPERVAWSFAIGLSLAWNPLLGLHTAMILALCFFARTLHRPLIFAACVLNNPWTLVPMATASTILGSGLLGRGWSVNLKNVHWSELGWRSFLTKAGFAEMIRMLKPVLAPYLLGGFVMSLLALPIGYVLMLFIARRLRARHTSALSH
jgi:uncharacterized protein